MRTFVCPSVIACEGEGDKAFLEALIATRDLGMLDVHVAKGNKFGEFLQAVPIGGDVERVLIVTDSDDDPAGTFARVCGEIEHVGLEPPNAPLELSRGPMRLAVLLLPWHDQPGNLEALCLRAMVDSYREVAACLDQYVQCCPNVQNWRTGRQAQMRFRTMASSICETDPNTPLRYAWSRTDFCIDLNHHCFDTVAAAIAEFGRLPA